MRESRNTPIEFDLSQPDSRKVTGYAVVFNRESDGIAGFKEVITPHSLDGVIEKSDVLCLLNHNEEKGVLARCNKGTGSLTLEIDENGLKYTFEAPNTALGDELIEGIKRGDISTSSFSFSVVSDKWDKLEDGTYLRTIEEIEELFDVSPVYRAAYSSTSVTVDTRGLDELKDKEKRELKQYFDELKEKLEMNSVELMDEKEQLKLQAEAILAQAENEGRQLTEEEQAKYDEITAKINEIDSKLNSITNQTNEEPEMRKFSLIQTINDVASNRTINEVAKSVISRGRSEMRKAGQSYNGQIVLPVEYREESPSTPTVPAAIVGGTATYGKENVPTDKLGILEPLRANLALVQAGATFMTGLVGDVSIPVYSGSNVAWADEIATAADGKGTFSEVLLQPKRLTAYVDVSKQFLLQDSNDAEAMLKRDIINAVSEKLEKTILGNAAGSTTQPAGIFNGVTADTANVTYSDIVNMEATLEGKNVTGDIRFIVAPTAKAILKTTVKGTNAGAGFIMQDNEIEGYPVLTSSAVATKGVVMGNFSDYVIGQWGGFDLTVDPYTKAAEGKVRLVINAYFDAKPRRADAFAKKVLK